MLKPVKYSDFTETVQQRYEISTKTVQTVKKTFLCNDILKRRIDQVLNIREKPKNHKILKITKNHISYDKSHEFEDHFLHCFECDKDFIGECTEHRSRWILNKKVECVHSKTTLHDSFTDYFNENLDISECFCKSNSLKHIKTTLPTGFLLVKSTANDQYGVWSKICISMGTIIGPFLGRLTNEIDIKNEDEETDCDFIWSLVRTSNVANEDMVDARDAMTSNYLRFIQCCRNGQQRNLTAFQFDGKIFYQATKDILPNQELLVSYTTEQMSPTESGNTIKYRKLLAPVNYQIKLDNKYKPLPIVENKMPVIKNVYNNKLEHNPEIMKFLSETWGVNPQMTVKKMLELLVARFPEHPMVSENRLSQVATKYEMRPKGGSTVKVDEEIIEALREILHKNHKLTGPNINKALRKMLPDKPELTVKTAYTLIKKYHLRPIVGEGDDIDEESVYALVKMFHKDPKITTSLARQNLKKLFQNKPLVSYKTIDRIVLQNRLRSYNANSRKIDDEMKETLKEILKENKFMTSATINKKLQEALPNKPKVADSYIGKVATTMKLRPRGGIQKKVDDEMIKFMADLYFNEKLNCEEINQRLREQFPEKPQIKSRLIFNYISRHELAVDSHESDESSD